MQNIEFLLIGLIPSFILLYLYLRSSRNIKYVSKQVIEKAKKEVETRLYTDELTGLKNKKALEDSIKDKYSVVIILLDIDSFEDLNELYGFVDAELVLVEVSNILKEFENEDISLYRLGGDVFCLSIVRNIPFEEIFTLIESLNKTFLNRKIYTKKLDTDILISMTMGISIFQEDPILTASMALKKAKSLNHSYFVYNNELDSKEQIIQSLYWREKMKKAVEENKIVPFYQPIVNKNKEVIKYETLMRIQDYDENNNVIFATPDRFLGISFKTKQYLELSRVILQKSFENLLKTNKAITINLSFKDILNYDFIDTLDLLLGNLEDKDRSRLVFEILESESLNDYDFLEEFLVKYKKLGVKIAIDDFGSGYSNFFRIIRIKPDYIKIDGSLIEHIDTDKNSYEIVKSIIAFSQTLGIKVIAEYVHSEKIFNILLAMGIDEFQGYYLGKPSINFD